MVDVIPMLRAMNYAWETTERRDQTTLEYTSC